MDTSKWYHSGRGNVSAELAKSNAQIISQESSTAQEGMSPTGEGKEVQNNGAKPLYATGSSPFHTGRGLGRGQS